MLIVSRPPLILPEGRPEIGEPCHGRVLRRVAGQGFADEARAGDWMSLHWDWVCAVLDDRTRRNLVRYTDHHLHLASETLESNDKGCTISDERDGDRASFADRAAFIRCRKGSLMLMRMLLGAAAGAVATVPQSLIVWGARAVGVYRRKPPPQEIADSMHELATEGAQASEPARTPLMLAEHFAFGAVGGAAFGLATGVIRPTTVAGLLAGLAIWKASYDGWVPALRIMPPPEEDESGRVVTMVIAHVAYGLALGTLLDRWTRRD